MNAKGFRGALLAILVITSLMALALYAAPTDLVTADDA
ncbi:unnamed protein product, partial [marine sediment metagenome]